MSTWFIVVCKVVDRVQALDPVTHFLILDICNFCLLFRYLMGIEGGSKKPLQAKEMVKDLAKFHKFVNAESVNFESALDKQAVMAYLNELRCLEVGPSGQVNKLQTIIVS